MRYEYELTFDDFKSAQRLARKCTVRLRLQYVFNLYLVPILMFFIARQLWYEPTLIHNAFDHRAVAFGLICGGLAAPVMWPFKLRSMYRNLRKPGEPHTVFFELLPDELVSGIPGRSEARLKPATFWRFAENSELALLYLTRKSFLYIPKRVLPADAWSDLRAWLQTNGIERAC